MEKCKNILKIAEELNIYDFVKSQIKKKRNFEDIFLHMISKACQYNNESALKKILQYKEYNPLSVSNIAIQYSIDYLSNKTLQILLEDNRINPSTNYNYALIKSITKNNIEAVDILLKHKNININDFNVIDTVIRQNKIEILKKLLNHKYLSEDLDFGFSIQLAASFRHIEILELLLNHEYVKKIIPNLSYDTMTLEIKRAIKKVYNLNDDELKTMLKL